MAKQIIAAFVLSISCLALGQSAQPSKDQTDSALRKAAEDKIAQKVQTMRLAFGLPKLKRINPSKEEVQLTCTAALSGKKVYDPMFGAFYTYSTTDLSFDDEVLKQFVLGTAIDSRNNSRYPLAWKEWGRYSVVVYLGHPGGSGSRSYTVALARHATPFEEAIGRMSFDNPIKDANDWKEQVDSECRNKKR